MEKNLNIQMGCALPTGPRYHLVEKQGYFVMTNWTSRILTVDDERGFIYLSKKDDPDARTHHKMMLSTVNAVRLLVPPERTNWSFTQGAPAVKLHIRGIVVPADGEDDVCVRNAKEARADHFGGTKGEIAWGPRVRKETWQFAPVLEVPSVANLELSDEWWIIRIGSEEELRSILQSLSIHASFNSVPAWE